MNFAGFSRHLEFQCMMLPITVLKFGITNVKIQFLAKKVLKIARILRKESNSFMYLDTFEAKKTKENLSIEIKTIHRLVK